MTRVRIDRVFDTGVSAINALATMGRGMRIGLFAGSGVGKTTLLGMMARHAQADVVVVGMIGERGREIREFIEDHLGDAKPRSVVVASPADDTALGRLHGAYRAAAAAEYFRDQGRHVLLVVDSLTRLAMALREIGLAAGEPPATKGYPPSVFGALSAYVERAGNGSATQGSITAIYTVLVEGDDHVGDPVADTARSVLDGHIVLSRAMSEAAIFPPIDITASLSRPMPSLVTPEHQKLAARFRALWARRAEKQDIIDLGAYAPGRDPLLDEALRRAPMMEAVLRQDWRDAAPMAASVNALNAALSEATP
jgi:flagellum-specific ATP synthase